MKPALRMFALWWLPGLLMLLAGMMALLRTGRVDPRDWTAASLILIAAALAIARRGGLAPLLWAGMGAVGTVLLFAWIAADRPPEPYASAWLAATAGLAMAGGELLARRSWWFGSAFCAGAMLLCWLADRPQLGPSGLSRPRLAVISGLPLFWREGAEGAAARVDAPVIALLRQHFAVTPVDSPLSPDLTQAQALLLAHPRLLSPAELVAIDAWVRGGGTAVVLADPMLRWPLALPLGDRRRPPAISLLSPLLTHWGLQLMPPQSMDEDRHFLDDGTLLTIFAASRFRTESATCRLAADGLLARCRIGRGRALLLADADLIDDRLWLTDPATPLDRRNWTADTPDFIARALQGVVSEPGHWLRSEARLLVGLRWAMLFGIFWAAMGSALLRWPLIGISAVSFRSLRPRERRESA
ncbi:MAG TPA: hypothetical protein VJM09_07310 [Sphingobium sp.]|nr:hypothetical protein [Sphingobium sp.]